MRPSFAVAAGTGIAATIALRRWMSGRVEWWEGDRRWALGALLGPERDLVRRAERVLG